jgi:tRNA-modifying protein YgfZ
VGQMTLLISRLNRTGQAGLEVHVLNKHLQELSNLLALEEKPYTEVQNARVRAGIPDPLEDGFLGDLPQECGLEFAVSYKKGCYIGQEIMARLEARGNSRHRLALLEGHSLEGHALPSHFDLEREGKKVGRTGLSAGNVVLAKLRKELEDGETLELDGSSATVRDLSDSFKVL